MSLRHPAIHDGLGAMGVGRRLLTVGLRRDRGFPALRPQQDRDHRPRHGGDDELEPESRAQAEPRYVPALGWPIGCRGGAARLRRRPVRAHRRPLRRRELPLRRHGRGVSSAHRKGSSCHHMRTPLRTPPPPVRSHGRASSLGPGRPHPLGATAEIPSCTVQVGRSGNDPRRSNLSILKNKEKSWHAQAAKVPVLYPRYRPQSGCGVADGIAGSFRPSPPPSPREARSPRIGEFRLRRRRSLAADQDGLARQRRRRAPASALARARINRSQRCALGGRESHANVLGIATAAATQPAN